MKSILLWARPKSFFWSFVMAAIAAGLGIYMIFFDVSLLGSKSVSQVAARSSADGGLLAGVQLGGRQASTNDLFAWGGMNNRPKNNLDFMKFSAEDAKNPMKRANFYLECQSYLTTRGDAGDELAFAQDIDPSGKQAEFIRWMREAQETRCGDVTPGNIKEIDGLMMVAANNGEVAAKTYFLNKDFKAANEALNKSFAANTGQDDPNFGKYANQAELLNRAEKLALQGDPQAAVIASKLASQGDDPSAAMTWLMLGLQDKGQAFSVAQMAPDTEPFSNMSSNDYQAAMERAKSMFAALPR